MVKREKFLKQIRPFYHANDLLKVIIGMRRVGKSVLLSQIADDLRADGVPEDAMIAMNFELFEFSGIKTAEDLHGYLAKRMRKGRKYHLFFDEIQMVEGFEAVVNSLRASGKANIFMTGSNAHLLSGELATRLAGRFVQFGVTPFTLSEAAQTFANKGKSMRDVFDDYIQWGGLPGRFAFGQAQEIGKYLGDVYDSIVLRDIIQRSGIRDIALLDDEVRFLIENIGSVFSARSISKYLKGQSRSVSSETLYNHIRRIVSSLLFTRVDRYDIRGKSVFATLEKYYIADVGLLQLKRSSVDANLGGRLENIVAMELMARGYKIAVGVLRNAEIDFVAEKNGNREYVQVAYGIDSDATLKRETGAFDKIKDHHPKILITADGTHCNHNGIQHFNAIDWLLGNT